MEKTQFSELMLGFTMINKTTIKAGHDGCYTDPTIVETEWDWLGSDIFHEINDRWWNRLDEAKELFKTQ